MVDDREDRHSPALVPRGRVVVAGTKTGDSVPKDNAHQLNGAQC